MINVVIRAETRNWSTLDHPATIDLSYNDVKREFVMLHEVWLAREKRRANQIARKFNFSAFDVIMKKVY